MCRLIIKRTFWALVAFLLTIIDINAGVLCSVPDTLLVPIHLDTTVVRFNLGMVPTSILEDFGETPVNFETYNGESPLCDTNYVNFRTLNGILAGLSSSRVSNGLQIPSDITSQMSQQFESGGNPVGIVAYKYNRTYERAVANHYLDFHDGQYYYEYDAGGQWVNPYDDKYVMAFSPYMNICGNTVTYTFSASQRYTNLPIQSVYFDAGDGEGYQSIDLSNDIVYATYDLPTTDVELKLRIMLEGGKILESHSRVAVLHIPNPPVPGSLADVTYTFACDSIYFGYLEPVTAKVSVKFANGSNLTKPLIIAEGFDPFSDSDGILGMDRSGNGLMSLDKLNDRLIELIDSLNYDLVYIDWLNSRAPIQANAVILKQVINWVNANKSSSNKNILLGRSIGGVIARYALRTMELAGITHDVGVYVSDDAPHYGVNVPIGYVYLLQRILNGAAFINNYEIVDIIRVLATIFSAGQNTHADDYIHELFALCDAPAIRQMLMHYVSPQLEYESQLYNDFQSTLNSLGFPQGDAGERIINLAISNGGKNYRNNEVYHMHFEGSVHSGLLALAPAIYSFLTANTQHLLFSILSAVTVFSGPRLNIAVYRNEQGAHLMYDSSFSWKVHHGLLEGQERYISRDSLLAPSSFKVFDSDAGSIYTLNALTESIDTTLRGNSQLLGGFELSALLKNRFMFVPSVSSLAYKKQRSNLFIADRTIDFANEGVNVDTIPFTGYKFVLPTMTEHLSLGENDFRWIDRVGDFSLSVDTLSTGYLFSIIDANSSKGPFSVTWSIKDPQVANVDSSTGMVTASLGGTSTVYADIVYLGGHYVLQKEVSFPEVVFPGFPSYTLKKYDDIVLPGEPYSGDYTIEARESFSLPDVFNQNMVCHWGIKENPNSSIQWTTTSYSPIKHKLYYFCNFPNTATERRVYFYVSIQDQLSPTYSITCRIPPSMFVLDGNGNLYTEDMDEPFAQVKGATSEVVYFSCVNQTLTYDHWPTWAEFGTDMLNNEEFVNLIKTLKPWGDEELIMIPYSYHSDTQTNDEFGFITIKYDGTL